MIKFTIKKERKLNFLNKDRFKCNLFLIYLGYKTETRRARRTRISLSQTIVIQKSSGKHGRKREKTARRNEPSKK